MGHVSPSNCGTLIGSESRMANRCCKPLKANCDLELIARSRTDKHNRVEYLPIDHPMRHSPRKRSTALASRPGRFIPSEGRPLWVARPGRVKRRHAGRRRRAPPSLWRRELLPLPVDEEPVTLGEGMTPLLPCPLLGHELGIANLLVKDEAQLPTGSFKSRGMAVAVSMAKHLGITRMAIPTAGNAGGALAAYAARAGIETFVFMPEDTPRINAIEAHLCGARVFHVNGLITDCGRIVREGVAATGWFDMSTLKGLSAGGKKTMGWNSPSSSAGNARRILCPTGGTGLIGEGVCRAARARLAEIRQDASPDQLPE